MNQLTAMYIAYDTLWILHKGQYTNKSGKNIMIKEEVTASKRHTRLYTPSELDDVLHQTIPVHNYQTKIEITTETSLMASKRLIKEGYTKVACLNFANARNPGGGFLIGSLTQEESLARASGLYPTITQMKEMYQYNQKQKTGFYSDYMIFSPNVPVFRDDNGVLLVTPYNLSVITSPAVHVGVIKRRERKNLYLVKEVMKKRILKILTIAKEKNQEVLVLGAFGCGVFKNQDEMIARLFKEALEDVRFKNQFKKVVFAIYETNQEMSKCRTFCNVFFL